ncbi:MAG: F0F1 ATP synthase subunit epsilon [Alphaproteobacteria bacterium]|nr:F0F1 ATP synthase subunit epsilon [Alphaproteobacteria bacterium]
MSQSSEGPLQFDLASPVKLAYSGPVKMAVMPGAEGMFGVLAGHAAMAAMLSFGVVEVYRDDTQTVSDSFFVIGGFCEVMPDRCVVMADHVEDLKSLDRFEVEEEIERLNKAEEPTEEILHALKVAHAKHAALQGKAS